MAERDLVKAVIQLINARGGFAWRNQSGRTLLQSKGKTRAIHMGRKGLPDVIGILPTYLHVQGQPKSITVESRDVPVDRLGGSFRATIGRLIAVECKRPGNKPTREQEAMLAELRKRGALVVVAFDIKDVEKALTP